MNIIADCESRPKLKQKRAQRINGNITIDGEKQQPQKHRETKWNNLVSCLDYNESLFVCVVCDSRKYSPFSVFRPLEGGILNYVTKFFKALNFK